MFEGTNWTPFVMAMSAVNWTAVIAALITGSTAACGPMLLWHKQSVKEKYGIQAAFLAEISVLVEMLHYRRYLAGLRDCQSQLQAFGLSQGMFGDGPKPITFTIPVDEGYNRVYRGNINKIGMLPADQAAQIVRFYQYADAFKVDVSVTGCLGIGTKRHEDFKEVADLLQQLLDLGSALVAPRSKRRWVFGTSAKK